MDSERKQILESPFFWEGGGGGLGGGGEASNVRGGDVASMRINVLCFIS